MRTTDCEYILMAAMALRDGEDPGLPVEQIERHIAECESCRLEVEQSGQLVQMLGSYDRGEMEADLWPGISAVIARNGSTRTTGRGVFALLAGVLVVYKLVEMLPDTYPGHFLKIAPVAMAAALFIFLRENPFKINTELTMEQ